MNKIFKCSLIFIILFTSCKPNTIIPEDDMVSIIVKIQLIDATTQSEVYRTSFSNKDTIDYYSRTIKSFGYTQVQFDSSLNFYARTPKVLDAIYDKVITELSKIETSIAAANKTYDDSVARDTLRNLWTLKSSYELPDTSGPSSIDFIIPVSRLGVYTIVANVFIHKDDSTLSPSMQAYFFFDDKSKKGVNIGVTTKMYEKAKDTITYTMQLELQNSLVTHLKGSLFTNKNTDHNCKAHASIKNIKICFKPGKLRKTKSIKNLKRVQQLEVRE